MLKSGRLPPERIGNVVGLILQRGGVEDLRFLFDSAASGDAFPLEVRTQALEGLATAAETRKVQPEFDAKVLQALCTADAEPLRLAALRLAGAWRANDLAPTLRELVLSPDTQASLRRAALDALVKLGGDSARTAVERLASSPDVPSRLLGTTALVEMDLDQASKLAAALIREGAAGDRTGELLAPFCELQGGSDKLADSLRESPISSDSAKLALRHLYAAGRSDPPLVAVLSAAAGLSTEPPMLDAEQLKALSAEVLAQGDANRGEMIFRRADLSCMKCHAVSGAGGDIGPDLSPVGSVSPPDYIITSILNPDLSIKETFLTRAFVTDAGKIYQGIVADRDDQRVVVKEATGERVTIPTADILEEVEGKSLMPKGLAGFLSHQEFLDLVRFLSELGKPGEFEVRSKPTVQRWLTLDADSAQRLSTMASSATIGGQLLSVPENAWQSVYAKVAGGLPLDEIAARLGNPPPGVLYLRADLDVASPGAIDLQLDSPQGITAWIDGQPVDLSKSSAVPVESGRRQLFFRVDSNERESRELRALVDKAHGSTVAVTLVGGR